jgi:hypothetical protein
MLCREIVGTTVKQLKTSILFIVMQCCFSQVTFLNYSIVFYNCYVPELSSLQDANSSIEALNRLQGVILYSSAVFAWLISHQPAVLFFQNKPANSNQPAVLFSQNKPAPAISHQPTEQADHLAREYV